MFKKSLPRSWRKPIYAAMFCIGIVVGAIQVACLSIGNQPEWLDVVLAVFAFLGGSTHGLAGGNVDDDELPDGPAA